MRAKYRIVKKYEYDGWWFHVQKRRWGIWFKTHHTIHKYRAEEFVQEHNTVIATYDNNGNAL